MGSTDNQSNQKKSDATEPDESTTVDSSSVSTSKDDAEVSSIEHSVEDNGVNEQAEVEESAVKPDTQSQQGKQLPNVETVYLDDSKVGIRYDNYPLSTEVIKGLDDLGHRYLSRYQQSLLDLLTLGEDRWFSINLASNRGVVIGAYLVDLAQTDLSKTTAILCVAVPKIRSYFQRDLLSIAKYTGVKILSVDDELPAEYRLEEQPNIVIASIEMVTRLTEQIDMSGVEVVYFDEVEKTIRDAEEQFVGFVEQHSFPQVVLQSSYYSASLIESVHKCKADLDPTRLYKRHQNMPSVYAYKQADSLGQPVDWQVFFHAVLPKVLLSRIVVLTDDGAAVSKWLRKNGWDTVERGELESLSSKDLDGLRENRIQILVTNKQVLLQTKGIEYDVLLSLDSLTDADAPLLRQNKRVQTVILYQEPSPSEVFSEVVVEPLSDFDGASNRSESMVHALRQNSLQELGTDWTSLVDDILKEVDGRQLLGEALRLALQSKRGQQGYIRSVVYKSDNKDVFQRRNRKRTR